MKKSRKKRRRGRRREKGKLIRGRVGESWGDPGKAGESWGDLGRAGEGWGELGRSWAELGQPSAANFAPMLVKPKQHQ